MLATKRKREPRRARQHAAWITFEDDFISHDCQILDVSLNGAKLTADIAVAIGSRFRLSAVPHASFVSSARSSGAAEACSHRRCGLE